MKARRFIAPLVALITIGSLLAACASPQPEPQTRRPRPERTPDPYALGSDLYPPEPVVAPDGVPEFSWENATVYFVMTDRFYNGNPDNDNSYGRRTDIVPDYGLFHGGDLAGLTQKIEEGYFAELGVDALWITSPLEQIHGWIGGGTNGDFAHYAYHGYYPMDFTEIDDNMGTEEEFATFMQTAHANGIRVVMDIVMNHVGYNTVKDMVSFEFGAWTGDPLPEDWIPEDENWLAHHDYINYDSGAAEWAQWWGGDWVRAGLPGYPASGSDDITQTLEFLPDLLTESTEPVALPPFLQLKRERGESSVEEIPGATVREYLITWLTDWVREYGIDGFRVDTAKHVELDAWDELKERATTALREWKAENPDQALDDLDFWMTGEVFGFRPYKNEYFANGFDSLINFNFQRDMQRNLGDREVLNDIYQQYADVINTDASFNALTYLSSHDTRLFFDAVNEEPDRQMDALTSLYLLPGAIHLFYGDEVGRRQIRVSGDATQGTRTPFPWDEVGNEIHQHAQLLGQFRRNNIAIGAGSHAHIEAASAGYAFVRDYFGLNTVLVVLDAPDGSTVPVADAFADGTTLVNVYTGASVTVADGQVILPANEAGIHLMQVSE